MLLSLISSSLGQFIAALAGHDHRLAALLLSVSLISLTLVGGFYVSLSLLPPWVLWLVYLSPVNYAVPNMLYITLGDSLIACRSNTNNNNNNTTNNKGVGGEMGCRGDGLTARDIASQISLGLPAVANVSVLLCFLFVIKIATLLILKQRLQVQN